MANPEHQLLSHIIRNNALASALEWGMREEDFLTDEGRRIFTHMMMMRRDPRMKGGMVGKYGMKNMYPTFDLCDDPSMTLEGYCTLVRQNRLQVEVQAIAHEMATSGDNPVTAAAKAAEKIQRSVLAVGYGMQDDVTLAGAMRRGKTDHDLQASGVDLSIGQWPWEPFNDASGGLRADDYIVFYGRPKSKKSWVLAAFAASLYLQDKQVLLYTKEMTSDNLLQRVGACIAGLPYQEFRRGRLNKEEQKRLDLVVEATEELQRDNNMICLNGKDTNGSDTIEWLQAKVEKYRPSAVFIDGLYLMNDSRGSRGQKDNFRVQNISRAARQMVLATGVPVVATMQATRGAAAHKNANLDEIAFSDSIAQDVTAAIRVINEDAEDKITLVVGGAREYRFSGCQIWGVPATNFNFIQCLNQKEIDRIKERDERGDEKETGTQPARKPAVNKQALRAGEARLMNTRFSTLPRV